MSQSRTPNFLGSGETLGPNQDLYHQGYVLSFGSDENLVIGNLSARQDAWRLNITCESPHLTMQTDGNLVIQSGGTGSPVWASNTHNNPGAFLQLERSALVIYRAGSPFGRDSQPENPIYVLWTSYSGSRTSNSNDSPSRGSSDRVQTILAEHNKYRVEVGVLPLQWSDNLAASAQQWANHLAATGKLEHSRAGENLAQGSSGAFSVTQLVDMWAVKSSFSAKILSPMSLVPGIGQMWVTILKLFGKIQQKLAVG